MTMTSSAPGFRISRATGSDGFSVDTHAKFVFEPALESDQLFDALRVAYPHAKTHAERKRQAVLDFLVQEREDDLKALDQLVNGGESTSPVPSCSTDQTQSVEQTPASTSFASFSPSTSDQPSPVAIAPNFQSETPNSASNPSFHVWNSSSNQPVKLHKRRCMTDKEKEEYRQRRLVGSCHSCKQKRRKCRHHELTATHPVVPNRASKRSKSSKATFTPASAISPKTTNDSSRSEAAPQSYDPSPVVPTASFLKLAEFTFEADMSGQLFDGDFPLFSESDFFNTTFEQPLYQPADFSYPHFNAQFPSVTTFTPGPSLAGPHESISPGSAADWLMLPSPETNVDFYSTNSSSPQHSPDQPFHALSSDQYLIWPEISDTTDREKMKVGSRVLPHGANGIYIDRTSHTSSITSSRGFEDDCVDSNGQPLNSGTTPVVLQESHTLQSSSLAQNEQSEGYHNRRSLIQSENPVSSHTLTKRAPGVVTTAALSSATARDVRRSSTSIVEVGVSSTRRAGGNRPVPCDTVCPSPNHAHMPLVLADSNASGQNSWASPDEVFKHIWSLNEPIQSSNTRARPPRSASERGGRVRTDFPKRREAKAETKLILSHHSKSPTHLLDINFEHGSYLRISPTWTFATKKKRVNIKSSAMRTSMLPKTMQHSKCAECAPGPRVSGNDHGLRSAEERPSREVLASESDHTVIKSAGSSTLSRNNDAIIAFAMALSKLIQLGISSPISSWLQSLLSFYCLQAANLAACVQNFSAISVDVAPLLGTTFERPTGTFRSLAMTALVV